MFVQQVVGLSTGVSCATQIANLVLSFMDSHVKDSLVAYMKLYKRFVDDAIIVYCGVELDYIMCLFNSFDSSIIVTHDNSEKDDKTTFLDLSITGGTEFSWQTHRKAANTYAYLPFDSCHPQATKLGIVHTEHIRLMVTCKHQCDYEAQVSFFLSKLHDRGYPFALTRAVSEKYPWSRKDEITAKGGLASSSQVLPLKLPFSTHITELGVTQVLKMHEHLLPQTFKIAFRIVKAFTVGKNLFRKRYPRFI